MTTSDYRNQDITPQDIKGKRKRMGCLFSAFIIAYLIGMMFIYGFLGEYYVEPNSFRAIWNIPLLMLETVFVLLGFGLLLTPYRLGRLTGMSMALMVVSFNFLTGVLIQELWGQVFLRFTGVNLQASSIAPNAANFWSRTISQDASPSYFSLKLSNLCSISYLVGMTGYIGRINIAQVFPSIIFFNILFYLNFYLNVLLSYSTDNKANSFVYLDDFGTTLVYLFGAAYGLIVCFFTKNRPSENMVTLISSVLNSVITLIGAVFIMACFIFTRTGIIDMTAFGQNYKFNAEAMIILFSMAASIPGNYIGCAISGRGMISFDSMAMSTLPGGIMVGALAGEYQNIGAALTIGLVSGIFSGIWMTKVHPRINRNKILDSMGMIGPILIVAFIGSFIIPASTIIQYYWKRDSLNLYFRNEQPETDYKSAQFSLAYFAVTLGIGLVTGLILGIIARCSKNDKDTDFNDGKFYLDDFGLYEEEPLGRTVKSQIRIDSEKQIANHGDVY